jgi:hypothetical protein
LRLLHSCNCAFLVILISNCCILYVHAWVRVPFSSSCLCWYLISIRDLFEYCTWSHFCASERW